MAYMAQILEDQQKYPNNDQLHLSGTFNQITMTDEGTPDQEMLSAHGKGITDQEIRLAYSIHKRTYTSIDGPNQESIALSQVAPAEVLPTYRYRPSMERQRINVGRYWGAR